MTSSERVAASETDRHGDDGVGINFVDILFALVIGAALEALTRSGHMSAAGRSHLIWASLLTILSWIGYHRSQQVGSGKLTFDLRAGLKLAPLGRFAVDIALVVLYWIAVETTESGFADSSSKPSWTAEVGISLAAFILYVLWDLLAWLDPWPGNRKRKRYLERRRAVSLIFAGAMALVAGLIWIVNPSGDWPVAAVGIFLSVLVVGYRVVKDTEFSAISGESQTDSGESVNQETAE